MKRLIAVACMLSLFAGVSFAKSKVKAEEKYGLGYSVLPAGVIGTVDAVSFRYWKKGELGFEGLLGYYSFDGSNNGSLIGAKFLKPVKDENNLTAYWFGMLGLLNASVAGASNSGNLIAAGVGVEFFFNGLPNLGFSAEIGISNTGGDAYTGTKGNALFGNSVNNAGIRYYFD